MADGGEGGADANSRGARLAQEARPEGGGRVSLLWLAGLCLLLTMFFSAAEMAFIAANRLRLRHLAEEGSTTAALYLEDRKSTRLNSSHGYISYAVFCL